MKASYFLFLFVLFFIVSCSQHPGIKRRKKAETSFVSGKDVGYLRYYDYAYLEKKFKSRFRRVKKKKHYYNTSHRRIPKGGVILFKLKQRGLSSVGHLAIEYNEKQKQTCENVEILDSDNFNRGHEMNDVPWNLIQVIGPSRGGKRRRSSEMMKMSIGRVTPYKMLFKCKIAFDIEEDFKIVAQTVDYHTVGEYQVSFN